MCHANGNNRVFVLLSRVRAKCDVHCTMWHVYTVFFAGGVP